MSTAEAHLARRPIAAAGDPSPEAMEKEEGRRRILEDIRELHKQAGGLSRVHRVHPALYAQARRAFGSWRAAVAAAGLDYGQERHVSLRRGLLLRDQRRAAWRALSRFLLDQPHADEAVLERARPELARRVRACWGGLDAAVAWATRNRAPVDDSGPHPDAAHAAAEA
jgi:hypothetical protein